MGAPAPARPPAGLGHHPPLPPHTSVLWIQLANLVDLE